MSISSIFDPKRSAEDRRNAINNLFDFLVRGGMADKTRTPSDVIDEGRKRTVHRYHRATDVAPRGDPVLLVPPLGASAAAMDMRRGCSLAEHMVSSGRPTYLVDYGDIAFADRDLGIEHWVNDVLPTAIGTVSADAGGAPVSLVGWCMGGLMSIVSTAAYPDMPVATIAMVASPFDFSVARIFEPLRRDPTGGKAINAAMKAMGGAPRWLTSPAFKLTSLPTYLKKPITLLRKRDDREALAQIEAVDELMNNMAGYTGRAILQVYERLLMRNELATGTIVGPTRTVHLADVRVPVINVAGTSDVLVPVAAAFHVGGLLPNSPDVRLETAPGGHLGVLTGGKAKQTTWALIDEFLDDHTSAVA